jgi:hypothetical protein
MWRLVAIFLLIAGLQACSVKEVMFGIEPDDLSEIEVGTTRGQVEDLLDLAVYEKACPNGTRTMYVYDRGQLAAPHPVAAGISTAVLDALTLGAAEVIYACEIPCQKGLLEIIFDEQDKVLAVKPRPYAYDVGWYCGAVGEDVPVGDYVRLSGKTGRICAGRRVDAAQTDTAALIGSAAGEMEAIGCEQ